jgi:hypothetical protein
MQPYAPFVGVLLLPDKIIPTGTSPVTLADGAPIALIRWRVLTTRARFEVLDPSGRYELARGQAEGFLRRNYGLYAPADGDTMLRLRVSLMGPTGRSRVTLPDGRVLTAKGNWLARKFAVTAPDGSLVARIVPTRSWMSARPDSYGFELAQPLLSPVQAIGLAQFIRAAVKSQRQSAQNRMRTS